MTDLMQRRDAVLGPKMTTFYRQPVEIVRGEGVWLWDSTGKRYLDAYNNVPHVGHGHPAVVEAIAKQAATLNTHTRYLHEGIVTYGERLTAKLADALDTMIMVCTGSEANDIALRLGWLATGKRGLIATGATYHGNTHLVSQLSSGRRPIGGREDWVARVPAPHSAMDGATFAANVEAAIAGLEASGHGFAALILDPFFVNEAFPTLPTGFLDETVALVRRAGGLVIADEVQPGFGRLGSHFWGHERAGVTPDVVTMGKPMGNGYPVAGVVTRRDLVADFRSQQGYFNTFGGSPVAAAAANAVLDVIEAERLQDNARTTGDYLHNRLATLTHPRIVETRGTGLIAGVVFDDDDGSFTGDVVERMKEAGVLLSRIGPTNNVLKIRPPMVFSRDTADLLVDTLAKVLEGMQ